MIRLFLTLTILFFISRLKAQVLEERKLNPGITKVKAKYFNGCNSKGNWISENFDSLGRVVEKNSYKKGNLLERILYQYNSNNDITSIIYAYEIERPKIIDTTKYEYIYINNKIVFQKCIFANNDSVICRLLKNQGDSILTYQRILYYNFKDKNISRSNEETYTLTYRNNLLITKEFTGHDNNKEITSFEYYEDGNLKHRTVQRIPEPKITPVYMGSPGSDNQFYKYSYDNKGRIRDYYTIVNNKTYKLATYNYIGE